MCVMCTTDDYIIIIIIIAVDVVLRTGDISRMLVMYHIYIYTLISIVYIRDTLQINSRLTVYCYQHDGDRTR